ncbi:MAG TPA: late competence development ComFB family protein [Bacilli bacterium]|nr:late competence development ComFB family protein [Bacilli bacterium]
MEDRFKLFNVMELIVELMLKEHLHSLNLNCHCRHCQLDVMAITLNRLPPQYVVKEEGSAYIKAKFMEDQNQANVLAALAYAATVVRNNPNHT